MIKLNLNKQKLVLYLICIVFIFYGIYCSHQSKEKPSPQGNKMRDFYGINAHLPDDSLIFLIDSAGISWVRISISWALIEPVKGTQFWDFPDQRIQALRNKNLNIILSVSECPEWASSNGKTNESPKNPQDWEDFMEIAARRYQDDIQYWGIWNEPNGGGGEYFNSTPQDFRDHILMPGIQGVKAGNPQAKIVAPGITIHTDWSQWMDTIFVDSVKDQIDVVSVHLYVNGDPDDLLWNLDYRSQYLDDILPLENVLRELILSEKELWLEETGWNTCGEYFVSEEIQGEYYYELLTELKEREWVDKVFFYDIIDDPEAVNACFGILRADYSPKPAYEQYLRFIQENPVSP